MFANISQREKVLIILAVLVIIIAVYYFYFYKPLATETASLIQDIELKENKLEADRKLIQKLPALRQEYNNLLAEQKKMKSFYGNKSIIDLLIDIREAVKVNDIELVRYQPVEDKEKIKMNIKLKGKYGQFCNLFRDFETWSGWFEFSNLRLKGQGETLDVSMAIIYHKMKE